MMRTDDPTSRPLDITEDAWGEAVRREATIRPLARAHVVTKAEVRSGAEELGLSVAQVYRLIETFRLRPLTRSLVVAKPGPRKGTRLLPDEVEQEIEAAIERVHKRREKPTLTKLQREIREACTGAGLQPPSRTAIYARVSARSLKEMVQARDGAKVARQRFVPVGRGLRPRAPLDLVQIDHTKVDIQLVDDMARAVLGRPWLTLLLDVCSRCVVGIYLSFDPPSSATVALAIANAALPKDDWLRERGVGLPWPMHGLPNRIHLDNAKEFHAKALKRGCQQHGITIDYRPPATPRFGGHIERLMGTLMKRVHALPGTTFSNVFDRGDYPSEKRAVLTLREFERYLTLEVLGPYHNDVHSALGEAPTAAWAGGLAAFGGTRAPSDPASFMFDFLPFEERVVRRDGIRLFNIMYFDGALAQMLDCDDRSCRVKYDPRDLSSVYVELPVGGHLRVPYADLGNPPVSLWEHRAATQTIRQNGRRTVNEAAIFEAVAGQRSLIAEAHASSKAARRAVARMPAFRAPATAQAVGPTVAASVPARDDEDGAVPPVSERDGWKTEFLP